ncbi:MAG: class I SAM-dependent methyltransferase [Chloroflexi bacterium]|nr:class I SAM-dependent methyltransferase [Chloroflexota bacterium]
MSRARASWRAAQWGLVTAATAFGSYWVRRTVEERPVVRRPALPATYDPAAARVEQRLADSPLWRRVESWIAGRAVRPFRVRPTFQRLRILNLDHGPGGIATALARTTPQDSLIVATDFVPGVAELARHRTQRRGVAHRIEFARAWPHMLPFPDESFDLVLSAGGLHHWPPAEAVLAEVRRVLVPAGRYLVIDFRRDLPLWAWLLVRLVQDLAVPRDLRAIGEPGASIAAAYAPHEAEWLAARAKLPELRIRRRMGWLAIERAASTLPEGQRSARDSLDNERCADVQMKGPVDDDRLGVERSASASTQD